MNVKGIRPEGQQAAGLEETDSGLHVSITWVMDVLPKAN
jgi:hypothetical protein